MVDDEIIWARWTAVETQDEPAGGAAPIERRTGTCTHKDGRVDRLVEERRPAAAGYTIISQDV
jgi:hypothetical protein